MTDYELYKLLDEAGYEPDEENLKILKENPELIDEWFLNSNNVGKKYQNVTNKIEKINNKLNRTDIPEKVALTAKKEKLENKLNKYDQKIMTNSDYARTMERAAENKERGQGAIEKFKSLGKPDSKTAFAEDVDLNNYLDVLLEKKSRIYDTDGTVVQDTPTTSPKSDEVERDEKVRQFVEWQAKEKAKKDKKLAKEKAKKAYEKRKNKDGEVQGWRSDSINYKELMKKQAEEEKAEADKQAYEKRKNEDDEVKEMRSDSINYKELMKKQAEEEKAEADKQAYEKRKNEDDEVKELRSNKDKLDKAMKEKETFDHNKEYLRNDIEELQKRREKSNKYRKILKTIGAAGAGLGGAAVGGAALKIAAAMPDPASKHIWGGVGLGAAGATSLGVARMIENMKNKKKELNDKMTKTNQMRDALQITNNETKDNVVTNNETKDNVVTESYINELIDLLEENGFEVTKENIITLMEELEDGNVAILDVSDVVLTEDANDLDYYTQILKQNGFKTNYNNIVVLKEAIENGHVLLEASTEKPEDAEPEETDKKNKGKVAKKILKNAAIGATIVGGALAASKILDKRIDALQAKSDKLDSLTDKVKLNKELEDATKKQEDANKIYDSVQKQVDAASSKSKTVNPFDKDTMEEFKEYTQYKKDTADKQVEDATKKLADADGYNFKKNVTDLSLAGTKVLNNAKVGHILGAVAGSGVASAGMAGIAALKKARAKKNSEATDSNDSTK